MLKREIVKSDEKIKVFLETSMEEYDEKRKMACTMFDRKIQDIGEKLGEFKVNK